jgi:hypothetical protein
VVDTLIYNNNIRFSLSAITRDFLFSIAHKCMHARHIMHIWERLSVTCLWWHNKFSHFPLSLSHFTAMFVIRISLLLLFFWQIGLILFLARQTRDREQARARAAESFPQREAERAKTFSTIFFYLKLRGECTRGKQENVL